MGRARRVVLIALAMLLACIGTACDHGVAKPGPADGASLDFTSKATLTVDDNGFTPNPLRVQVGDAITVVNKGTSNHGFTSDTVEGGTLEPGESMVIYLTSAGKIHGYDRAAIAHKVDIEVDAATS
jgi:plastocyanin